MTDVTVALALGSRCARLFTVVDSAVRPGHDATGRETFATRLTTADLAKSLAPAGAREGLFRIVYRFKNEQLLEVMNRTAHAAALSALRDARIFSTRCRGV